MTCHASRMRSPVRMRNRSTALEGRAGEVGVRRHHAPDLTRVMPREIAARDGDSTITSDGELDCASQSARAMYADKNRRNVDRRPLVPHDHFAAAIDESV